MTAENKQDSLTPAKPGDPTPAVKLNDTALFGADTPGDTPRPPGDNASQSWVGKALGKYQITGVLGQGGMGVVLKAHDPLIDRDVAIKILAGHLAADLSALGRFLSEARAVGKFSHPNVVAIYEICQEGPTYFLVMEFVPGCSLGDRLEAQGALGVLEATRALLDACRGVGAAHAAGLIHRDIKPDNFMRAADGSVKVADFGLAKAADAGRHFTQTGMVVGTPSFMSPEQCESAPLDHRSDLYALGATYFTLLTGKYPYEEAKSTAQLMYQHCHGPTLDPRSVNPAIPEACARIVARATAKAPADRYPSADAMLADLQAVAATLSGQTPILLPSQSGGVPAAHASAGAAPPGGRRLRWAVAALLFLALVGAAVGIWRPWQKSADGPPVPPPGGEPIKVGVLHSLRGTMSDSEAPVVDAVLFAIDEVNQEGGVLGRPVKAVLADGRSDDPTFAREAERLIAREGVCAVFGCWTSSSRKTVKPVFEAHDHLLIYPVQFEGLETSPCIFYLGPAPNQQIITAVRWAVTTQNRRKFFLVGSDYVFPRAANAILKDHLRQMGAEVVDEKYVPLGGQNMQPIVQAIVQAKPDMILNTINGDSNVTFFRALRAAGVTSAATPTLSFSIGEEGLRSLNPAMLEGDYAAWAYFQSVDTPENEQFVRRFQEEYPQRSISDPMETAYLGVKLWARAANEAQALDPKKVRRALLNQRLKGPAGEVRIDPDTQYCARTPRIARIDADGRFRVIWTADEPVRPEPYPKSRSAEEWRAFLHDLYTGWGDRWAAPEADPPGG
jgi:urea transport system substrate-binding protein